MLSCIQQSFVNFPKSFWNLILCLLAIMSFVALGFYASAQNSPDTQVDEIIANAGHSRVVEVGIAVRLDGSGSIAPSGLQITYAWSLSGQPLGSVAALSNANSPMPSFTPDVAGDYRADLIVTDSNGFSSATSTVLLTTGNVPPVAMAGGDRMTTVGQSLRLDPEGTFDANGDRLDAIWSIIGFPSESTDAGDDDVTAPENLGANNTVCPVTTTETLGTYHVVSATSFQQNPQLAVGQPLAEGTRETGNNSAITYYGPITMDLTGDPSIFVPEGELIEIVLSSAWGTSARAEILMSRDGENYTSLGTTGNGGSVYGAWDSNILRYDDFTVPVGGARFLQVSHQNSGVRADGVIYQTQCNTGDAAPTPQPEEEEDIALATLLEDDGGRFIFTPSIPGEYLVQLTASDTQGAQSTDVVTIYVLPEIGADDLPSANIAPIANAGNDQLITADTPVNLDGSQSTDVNGDRLTYQWSILSKPADSFSSIEGASSSIARFTPDTNRMYVLQLAVTDEGGLTDYDTIVFNGSDIAPIAISGGPVLGADGAISSAAAQVNAQGPQLGTLTYAWSALGLSAGQGEIDAPTSQSSDITFDQSSDGGGISNGGAFEELELFERYSLISFGDLNTNVDTAGATLVGGNVVGGSATFATQLQSANGTVVLEVIGDIRGGPKNINNGGDVHVGGNVRSRLNLNGGGQVIQDSSLGIDNVRQSAIALSESLSQLPSNSVADLPTNQHGPARLIAQPDENGVAVFDIPDGRDLFNNNRVQQIELTDNGAASIIFNIGGHNIQFNKGNFVGSISSDDISRRIIWNFHEAVTVKTQRKMEGSVLAPYAFFHNKTEVDGSVIANRVLERGRIGFPTYSGTGLSGGEATEETKFSLIQLAIANPDNPELGPVYDTTVLTIGNKRPVAIAATSNGNNNVTPGSDVTLNSTASFDGDNDPLTYRWSILSAPAGSQVEIINNSSAAIPVTADLSGSYIFQLIVSDGELMSYPTTVSFNVENTAPVANAGQDQTVSKGEVVVLSGLNSSDFDGNALSYTWILSEARNGSLAELSNADTATPTFETDLGGTYAVTLVVSDGFDNSQPDTVMITVENTLPVAEISGPSEAIAGNVVMLTAAGSSDQDGDVLTYLWALETPQGSSAVLSDTSALAPDFMPDIGGTYVVSLIVNDGDENSNFVSLSIEADQTNQPPVLASIGNQTVVLGETISLELSAQDPDGDAISYFVSPTPLPAGARFEASSGLFTYRPTSSEPRLQAITFGARDDILSDTELVSIEVMRDPEVDTTQLAGVIVDSQTGAPISGVMVVVGDSVALSGSDGSFLLENLDTQDTRIWLSVSSQTSLSSNGQTYATQQAAVNLIEGVRNVLPNEITLDETTVVANVDNSSAVSIEDAAGSIRVEIPEDSIRVIGVESRYWRFLFDSVVNDDQVQLAEVTLENSVSEGNLFSGGVASSSSVGSGNVASRAFDGSRSLEWRSAIGDVDGAWLAYDLGLNNEVVGETFSFDSAGFGFSGTRRAPVEWDVQVSTDGSTWRTIRNYTTTPDWAISEIRDFTIYDTFSSDISVSKLSSSQVSQLPDEVTPCEMFTIGPKGIAFTQPIVITVRNLDDLPAGTVVDLLVFTNNGFQQRGSGTVSADGSEISASVRAVNGGDMFAFAPRQAENSVAVDQPRGVHVPSLLNEGNYSTAIQLPGYRSNGANRGLSFVYNSTAANPAPIVAADVRLGSAIPDSVTSVIEIGGVRYAADSQTALSGGDAQSGDSIRQAVQLNAGNLPTGFNSYNFISVSDYGCAKVASVNEGNLFVDNQTSSPFGRGWSLAELSRIFPQESGSVLIREGAGTLKNFPAQADFSTLGDPVRLPLLGPYRGRPFDLDRDGDQDILWIAPEQSGIVVYENAGEETFVNRGILQAAGFVDVPEQGSFGPDLTGVAVGDIDGDGALDIVTGAQRDDGVFVFYGTLEDFVYTEAVEISDRDVRDIEIADVDADGRDDVIIMSATAIFTTEAFMISVTPDREPIQQLFDGLRFRNFIGIDIRDVNNDGIPDVLGRGRTALGVWFGRAGQVPLEEDSISGEFADTLGDHEAFVDLNGDGQDEILVGERGSNLRIYERQSNGRYALLETLEVSSIGTSASEFTVADLNGNGLEDIILSSGQDLVTFFNLEDGLVSEPEVVNVGFNVDSNRIADFNGDGGLDVVVDSQRTDELFVYYSDPSRTSRFIDPLTDYTVLTRNDDGSYNRRYNDGTVIVYAENGLQSSTTDSNGNVTGYAYDSQDRLISITDPVGLVTTFNYGANDRLSSIDYPDGRSAQWTYNSRGDLIRSVDVNGDVTTHAYDEAGRLTAQTDPRGLQTEIEYNAAGRYTGSTLPDGTELDLDLARTLGLEELGGGEFVAGSGGVTSVTDGRGNVTETLVNDFGSPLRITDPLGRVTLYERDRDNNVVVMIAPSSVTADGTIRTEIDYDSRGNVIAKREAVGTSLEREMTYAYEPVFNKMISMVDYDGFESFYTYDEFGNRVTETDPLGGVIQMTYDSAGLPTSQTDKNGNLTTYSYNALGLLASSEDASGTRQIFDYDNQGNMLRQIDDVSGSLQREMSYTYDEKNRKVTMAAADGGVMTYAYDGNDNVISTTDPTNIIETRSYDDRDRLETINDPASGTTVFVYDPDSNITRMTDALGETTEFSYDSVDRLLSSIDARGQLRAFAYDRRDNIIAVTDARANMTHMGYDELDRPIARTNPKGEQWDFAYDLRDNRTSATKPDGVELLSAYDGLSRLTRIAGGDIERTYAYDPQSNLLAANDNLNAVAGPDLRFTYDQENRLGTASVSNLFGNAAQNNLFTYTYDALDRRAVMTDSFGGNTAYAYDPVDRLLEVTTPQGETYRNNYDLAGRMLGRVAPNTTTTDRDYEVDTGRLMSQTQAASDAAFNGFTYDYTERGNIAEIAETGTIARTKRYSYDELERLTEVDVPEAPTENEAYTLDPEGNRLTSQLSNAHETDVANRLSGDDAYSYVYDLNGNLLSKTAKAGVARPDWSYDYDDLDQLISVARDGVEVERYRYDAFGRRSVIETANDPSSGAGAGTPAFNRVAIVNDGSDRSIDLVQDGAGTAQIQNRYTHGGQVDEPLSLEVFASDGSLDQTYTYHADHLGSIRFITDSLGNIANSYEYDSYGRPGFAVELVAQPFRYTGREYDEATELYHYRARQYDPETGRFLQEDPIGFEGKDLNLSRYVGSNPLNSTDPSGLTALGRVASTRVAAASAAGATVSRVALSAGGGLLAAELARKSGAISGVAEVGARLACNNFAIAAVLGGGSTSDCGLVLTINGIDERKIIGAGGQAAVVAAGGSPGGDNGRRKKCEKLAKQVQGTRKNIFRQEAELAADASTLPLTNSNGIFKASVLGHRALLLIEWQNYNKRLKRYDDLNCQDFGPSTP